MGGLEEVVEYGPHGEVAKLTGGAEGLTWKTLQNPLSSSKACRATQV